MGVAIPGPAGGTHKVKMSKDVMPNILIWVHHVPALGATLLVAHDDPVITQARDEDKAANADKAEARVPSSAHEVWRGRSEAAKKARKE